MRWAGIKIGSTRQRRRQRFESRVAGLVPMLMRAARGFMLQTADAEDLVHDTCVKALAADPEPEFHSDTSLAAWLRRILVNTYRDRYRREKRSPIRSTEYHATSDNDHNVIEMAVSAEPTPLQSVENRVSSSAIDDALAALPPEVRVVTVLFLISGLSYREIADVTDCPIGTVMSRLSRGRRLLRQQLEDWDPRQTPGRDDTAREVQP